MIHEIGVELKAALAANGCPIAVVDGPEYGSSVLSPVERVVIWRRVRAAEPVVGPKGAGRNPAHVFDRHLAAMIRIYARDARSGAAHWEHLRRMDLVYDKVLFALQKVLRTRKNAGFRVGDGEVVDLEDAKGTPVTTFAVYEFPFTVPRATDASTYAGAAATEVDLGPTGAVLTNVVRISEQGDSTPDQQPACGA